MNLTIKHEQKTNHRTTLFEPPQKRTLPLKIPLSIELKSKIIQLRMGENATEVRMAPEWYHHDNYDTALTNIVYPNKTHENEKRMFNTVARYRAYIGQSRNNFQEHPLRTGVDSMETLIVALDHFAKQFGGVLSFTNRDIPFDQAEHHAACGVANMSSAHLLANNFIPTAKFCFFIKLDYYCDIARSSETMQEFVLSFSNAIANVLACSKGYVRVLNVAAVEKIRRRSKITFGITTHNSDSTQEIAEKLKDEARRGYTDHPILKCILPRQYDYQWEHLISFFQLQKKDFDPEHNVDYRGTEPTIQRFAGLPCHLPTGWYRHTLNIENKYPDDRLWDVAFHGTHAGAVKDINKDVVSSRLIDMKREEAVQKGGEEYDKPGLYVTTHCNGGAHPRFTTTFGMKNSSGKVETYRVAFQCRVKPGVYTNHESLVDTGHAWRFVDPEAIRPDGILIKSETTTFD